MKRFFSLLFACLLLFVSSAHASASFMHTDGTRVLDANGDLLVLRSISISSEQTPENEVYRDIASLGFHSVRLHFNYDQLETDANPYQYLEAGLTWLDSHLAFAQKNGIGVILNLHVPQGGFQSWGKGDALWTDPENASRLTALWVMLATRYRDNPTVLGYSLLNEPCPVAIEQQAAYATWQTLATSVCSAVRAVDPNHTLVVEPVGMWTEGAGKTHRFVRTDENRRGFPRIDDGNVLYECHLYDPDDFTHQNESTPGVEQPAHLLYPNPFIARLHGENKEDGGSTGNESFDIQTKYWQTLQSSRILADDTMRYVRMGISIWEMGEEGEVWMDEFFVDEYDANGDFVQTLLHLDMDSRVDFDLYSTTGQLFYVPTGGMEGRGGTLYMRGVRQGAMAVLNSAKIPVRPGYFYQLSFSLGGRGLPWEASISPLLTINRGGEPSYNDRAYLAQTVDDFKNFTDREGMALYVGEFGTNLNSFQNDHGGEIWVRDMLSILKERQLGFNYFTYRNDYFGLYTEKGKANEALRTLFLETSRQ